MARTTRSPFTAASLLLLASLASAPAAAIPAVLEHDDSDGLLSYCRPYGNQTTLIRYAYCAAQGSGNAAIRLLNHVLDGNVTKLRDVIEKEREFEEAVWACLDDPGRPECPTEDALAFVA